jgi:oxalate decarboxylase/phosphoglucose isomerase-like protein (cupin superfamily)
MSGIQFEVIEHDGVRYAEVIWASSTTPKTRFCSPDDGSMQFGLLAHEAGFVEAAHYHKPVERKIMNLAQMFVVQKGKIAIDFFTPAGQKFREIVVGVGDAVLLIDGAHSLRVLEDMQCVSVKQGPFLGMENDKVEIEVEG